MNRSCAWTPLTALAVTLAVPLTTALAGQKLVINGGVASTDVRTLNGSAYVKVSDVARALGMIVVKRPDGYEMTKAGGANQVGGGLTGKVGDVLFDGRWRFAVLSVQTADSYALRSLGEPYDDGGDTSYDQTTRVLKPKAGNTLIVIRCRAINGQKTTQTLWIGRGETMHTALTDTQGESYPPAAHDFSGAPIQTKPLLPGAKIEFPVVFSVPQGTQLKDLVFTLRNNDSFQKGNDVRVSLAP